jgi:asparagine synthase (glutamine-hydrolysing)
MCGIAGFIDRRPSHSAETLAHAVNRMTQALAHRGPDDFGHWLNADAGVALGHRRLSILDLSPSGHQPMSSTCGRYVIAFNGEIYNFEELRGELEKRGAAPAWRGHSDTEVLLAAVSCFGVEAAVMRCVGMFAFALWDSRESVLYLVRDRIGEKPLYYGRTGNAILFASELKALTAHPGWHGEINRDAIALYLRHSYVPAPYSIYTNVQKLLPGTILSIKVGTSSGNVKLSNPVAYWSPKLIAETGCANQTVQGDREMTDDLERYLRQSIRRQMVADVPLGAFLSGGIDSSAVVALMQAQSDRPIRTFTIGFQEESYNEAEHAKAVARYLRTDHTELYVTPAEAMAVIPRLPKLYDEPFGDPSQIPTFLVCQLARRDVTVSLSGDGGDELFGGYNRYFWGRRLWKYIGWMPGSVRTGSASALRLLAQGRRRNAIERLGTLSGGTHRMRNAGDSLQKLADIIDVASPDDMYRRLVSHWKDPAAVVLGAKEPPTVMTDRGQWAHLADFTQRMMYLDLVSYLPDDILVKVDRAAMGVSLETRVPMLDHHLVEFAWRVPLSMKIRNGQGKWLLRQVLYRYVPKELVERPKTGFGVPIDTWLRGPLRDWAESLLDETRIRREGFFDPKPIRQRWHEHLAGERNWQYYLWDVLMFQAWLAEGASRSA